MKFAAPIQADEKVDKRPTYDLSNLSFFAQHNISFAFLLRLVPAWRRRTPDAHCLLATLAMSWLAFFIFAPRVAPQYFIWLTPFLLVFSPAFFSCYVGAGSIYLYVFYSTISHSWLWYLGASTNALSAVWAPWTLLAWLTVIFGSLLLLRNSIRHPGAAGNLFGPAATTGI